METLDLPHRPPSRWCVRGFAFLAALVAAFGALGHHTAVAQPTEHEVKAAMIFNITRFVEWPESAFFATGSPLVVAIVGRDGVGDALEPMLRGKLVNSHPFEVRRLRAADEIPRCHVLYLAGSEKRRIRTILETLGDSSTLTVADIEDFAKRGGHINLVVDDQRVRVLVNPSRAEASHLKISAKLMSLARVVGPTP